MGETVPHESQFALLDVLLDGIEVLVLGDLLLGICPAWDFHDHVEDLWTGGGRGGEEGDVVPWGDDDAVLLKVDPVFERVGSAYVT